MAQSLLEVMVIDKGQDQQRLPLPPRLEGEWIHLAEVLQVDHQTLEILLPVEK